MVDLSRAMKSWVTLADFATASVFFKDFWRYWRTTLAFGCLMLSVGNARLARAGESQFDLNSGNLSTWKDRILPTEEELSWTKIPWLKDLRSGIEEAAKSGKPVLLWTMNGHPLGCT